MVMLAAELLERFSCDEVALARRQVEADRVIAASLAGHLVNDMDPFAVSDERDRHRPWRLDPVPLVLDGAVFDELAAAVTQRMSAMERLLADLYGPRRAVREGWVPGELLASSHRYRLSAVGTPPPPRWLTTYALDVIALRDGSWRIVQDLADTPTGVGYAFIDRSVMAGVASELLGPTGAGELASISGFAASLRHALATTTDVRSPRIVLCSGGVDEASYVEHSALAQLLGFHLVEGADLVVRRGRLWLRTLGGLDPIDVVYRRLPDSRTDPIEVSATGALGVPGILLAAAEGGVVLANAHGSGVLEDALLAPYWQAAISGLFGEVLSLASLPDPTIGGPQPELDAVASFRDGRIDAAPVVVRLHAVAGPDGVTVMAGGNGRVLAPGDDPRRPTARSAKDVWVLGTALAASVIVPPPLPQVDLAASVPTRAADALFWLGRAAERGEAVARTARVVAARRQQDPSLVSFEAGRWARRMAAVLRVVRGDLSGGSDVEPADDPVTVLDEELAAATRSVGERLDTLVREAATVGEYLSVTTGRVLRNLARSRRDLADGRAPIDVLDVTLAELAAFVGLWDESTVRGPAWHFGDIGRRIERALVVLDLVGACLGQTDLDGDGSWSEPIDRTDIVDVSALEVLLASNESLVAYRRRHRSDVEPSAAIHLLLLDTDNPRSYAASMQRLADHVAAVEWPDGEIAVAQLRSMLGPFGTAQARQAVLGFGARVVSTWFATPVNPVVVRGTLT